MEEVPDHLAHIIWKRAIDCAVKDGDLAEALCVACVNRSAYRAFYEYVFREIIAHQSDENAVSVVVRFRVPNVTSTVQHPSPVCMNEIMAFDYALEVAVNRRRAEWIVRGLCRDGQKRCLPTDADSPAFVNNPWLRDVLLLPSPPHGNAPSHKQRVSLMRIRWPGCSPESQSSFPPRFANRSLHCVSPLTLSYTDRILRKGSIDLTDALSLLRDVVYATRFDPWHPPTTPHLLAGSIHEGSYREWLSNEWIVQTRPLIFVPAFWVDADKALCADLRQALRDLTLVPADNTRLTLYVFNQTRRWHLSLHHVLECFVPDADDHAKDAEGSNRPPSKCIALIHPWQVGGAPLFDAPSLETCGKLWFDHNPDPTRDRGNVEEDKELVLENVFLSDACVLETAAASYNLNAIRVTFEGWERPDQVQLLDTWVQQASTFLRGMMRAYASRAARSMTFRAEFRWIANTFYPPFTLELERLFDDTALRFNECNARLGGSNVYKRCVVERSENERAFTMGALPPYPHGESPHTPLSLP